METTTPPPLAALEAALERLQELQEIRPQAPVHLPLAGEVLFGSEVVHELEGWEWSSRLVKAGIERIEFLETGRRRISSDASSLTWRCGWASARVEHRTSGRWASRRSGSARSTLGEGQNPIEIRRLGPSRRP